jgi:hypothetical protein
MQMSLYCSQKKKTKPVRKVLQPCYTVPLRNTEDCVWSSSPRTTGWFRALKTSFRSGLPLSGIRGLPYICVWMWAASPHTELDETVMPNQYLLHRQMTELFNDVISAGETPFNEVRAWLWIVNLETWRQSYFYRNELRKNTWNISSWRLQWYS